MDSCPAVREQPWQGTLRLWHIPNPGKGPGHQREGTVFTVGEYLITCVRKSARTAAGHQHITSVGIGTGRYSVAQIYEFMDAGHTFRTASASTGVEAPIARYHCCGVNTLRSHSDRVWDDNLDKLPQCT